MKKAVATIGSLFALWGALSIFPSVAQNPQFPQQLPANTVVGRTGIGPGPAQAIPISLLFTSPLTGINIFQPAYVPPVAFPGTQPFQIQESVTGTCTTTATNCYYNFINIPSDNAVVGSGTSGTFVSGVGLFENWNYGGAAMTGNRVGAAFNTQLNQTTGNTIAGVSYGALAAYAAGNANDNGTGTGAGTSRGQIEAVNFIARLGASGTNYRALQGGEVDVSIATGGSTYEKVGWQITQLSTDAVQGATYDAALGIANQAGAVGWKTGILFGGLGGTWPFSSAGVAITCDLACGTLASVMDFSNATISGNFLKSPGFSVNGTGQLTSGSVGGSSGQLALNGSTSGTPTVFANSTGSLGLNAPTGQFIVFQNNGSQIAQIGSGGITVGTAGILSGLVQFAGQTSGSMNIATSATGGHLNFAGSGSAPTVTAGCNGAGSSITGTDIAGQVNGQTAAATTCTVTFGTTYAAAPFCVVSGQTTPVTSYTPNTGTLVINFASTASAKFNWICYGA